LDAVGNPIIAWSDNGYYDGTNWNSLSIHGRRWNGAIWQEIAPGSATGDGISVGSTHAYHPRMVLDSMGNLVAAYHDHSTDHIQIHIKRWNGTSWAEVGLGSASLGGVSSSEADSKHPRLAIDEEDNLYLVWREDEGGSSFIHLKTTAGGHSQPPPSVRAVVCGNLDGMCRAGNRVLIRACLDPRERWTEVMQVQFEYRPTGPGPWLPIPAANANHPNPDTTFPFFVHWDISSLADGDYDVRAVATDHSGVTDPDLSFITFTVASNCGHRCHLNWLGETEVIASISSASESRVLAADSERVAMAEVGISAGSVSPSTDIIATFRDPVDFAPTLNSLTGIEHFVDLTLSSGQTTFNAAQRATLIFTYPDADDDGLVDGRAIPETALGLYWFDGLNWQLLGDSQVDAHMNEVQATTDHLSTFAILSTVVPVELSVFAAN
jgi:hypothetical protein